MDSAFIAFKNVFLDHSYRLPEGFEPATYGTRHLMLNHLSQLLAILSLLSWHRRSYQVHVDDLAQVRVHQLHDDVEVEKLLQALLRREGIQKTNDLKRDERKQIKYSVSSQELIKSLSWRLRRKVD